jgi:hypothetical protein
MFLSLARGVAEQLAHLLGVLNGVSRVSTKAWNKAAPIVCH